MRAPGRIVFACAAAACMLAAQCAWAEPPTFVDGATFVQYSDNAIALADIGAGRLDIHYAGLAPDLAGAAGEGIRIHESQSGSYSLLVNPAPGADSLNVFADREARYALNYLVDRGLVVNELLGGHGVEMYSAYSPYDPDHAALAERGAPDFEYDPARGRAMIAGSLERAGAVLDEDGAWSHGGEPVSVTVFIRSDDPVRKSVGEIVALELSRAGLDVMRDYGDLNKAFVSVYGSDPAELAWSVYTEGWGGKSGFVRYDPVILAQMYAPWFSSMPGFNDPLYWNYRHDALDELTQGIYSGGFADAGERDELVWQAASMGAGEAVRVFLAARHDLYASGPGVDGVVNDFGAGVPSRFTPINAQTPSGHLRVGVSQIYQGAWNPVMGFGDTYSSRIWSVLSDPAVFRHPYNGSPMPVRASWEVETGGPGTAVGVPPTALLWDSAGQEWRGAPEGTTATSAVEFELALSDWHHGEPMILEDVMYAVYFLLEWSSERAPGDRTYDPEYASRAAQFVSTLKGVEPVGKSGIRVYVDYWHFDEAEIADWASVWAPVPWELYAGMEAAVSGGDASFSRSGAGASGVPWLSLLAESDARLVSGHLGELASGGRAPAPLAQLGYDDESASQRYAAAMDWIAARDHAVISNGPFYLVSYEPESRTISAASFDSESYPFGRGHWSGLADVRLARITDLSLPRALAPGDPMEIGIAAEHASTVRYVIAPPGAPPVASGTVDVSAGSADILIPADTTAGFEPGAHTLTLRAVSDGVLRPDVLATGFLVAPGGLLPEADAASGAQAAGGGQERVPWPEAAALAAAALAGLALWRRRASRLCAKDE